MGANRVEIHRIARRRAEEILRIVGGEIGREPAREIGGIKPIRIYPGSPGESGYNERFNVTLRREVLNAEWFTSIKQAQVVIETWLKQYNQIRPHRALNMRPPVPKTLSGSGT